ncbi:MAG: hypothetical protein QM477_03990 [Planctomycetota bacterium]
MLLLATAAFLPKPAQASFADGVEYAVIVNPTQNLNSLSQRDLKKYMELDRRYWPNGKRVTLFQRSAKTDLQKFVLDKVYRSSEKSLRKHFVSLMNRGKIPALPSVVRKSDTLLRLVSKKKGAIAIILESEVTDQVKVLAIDGKKPGDVGYLLQVPPADSAR